MYKILFLLKAQPCTVDYNIHRLRIGSEHTIFLFKWDDLVDTCTSFFIRNSFHGRNIASTVWLMNYSLVFVFRCYALVISYCQASYCGISIHIHWRCLIGTGAWLNIWLPYCQSNNPEECGQNREVINNNTKQSMSRATYLRYIHSYCFFKYFLDLSKNT